MIRHAQTLRDAVDLYCLRRVLVAKAEYQMRHSAELLIEWLGRNPLLGELDEDLMSRWVRGLEPRYARRYVLNHRANVLGVWTFAADAGLCREPRRRMVRKVKKPKPSPEAWSLEEMRRLAIVATVLPGRNRSGIVYRDYYPALIHVAYETGLRKGDLFGVERRQVRVDGRVFRRQHKTEEDLLCELTAPTLDRFRALPGNCPLAWRGDEKTYYAVWKRLCLKAGIPHGATHRIRRTGATHLWLEDPHAVQSYLGHRTPEMMWHYVDRSHSRDTPPRPPAIE